MHSAVAYSVKITVMVLEHKRDDMVFLRVVLGAQLWLRCTAGQSADIA